MREDSIQSRGLLVKQLTELVHRLLEEDERSQPLVDLVVLRRGEDCKALTRVLGFDSGPSAHSPRTAKQSSTPTSYSLPKLPHILRAIFPKLIKPPLSGIQAPQGIGELARVGLL